MFSVKYNYVDSMLAYVNEKYPEDRFQFVDITGGGVTAGTKTIIVTSQKYPDKEFYVFYYRNEEGKHYSDNYLGVIYADDVRADLEKLLSFAGGNLKLFYDPNRFACPNDNGLISYKEYAANKDACIGFSAVVQTDKTKDEIDEALQNALINSEIICWGTVYFVESKEEFDLLDSTSFSSFLFKKKYYAALRIDSDEAFSALTARWE